MKRIRIGTREIGPGLPVYVIAEMACSHDGSAAEAKALVDAAKAARADAVQLQFYRTRALVTPDHDIYDLLVRIELGDDDWREVFAHARATGMDVWVCTFDLPSVELAVALGADGIKLNSSDLSNPDMLRAVAKSGIPFSLGTGASTMDEVTAGVTLAEQAGAEHFVLMHGVQNFPTPLEQAHIRRVALLDERFDWPVGYADHTDAGQDAAKYVDLAALGMGATVLEKHYTMDRARKGTDHQAALNPDELADYVRLVRQVDAALGPAEPQPLSEADKRYRSFQKKSIVAARDIAEGESLTKDNTAFLRTGGEPGIPPTRVAEVLGKRAARGLSAFAQITLDDLIP